MPMPKLKYYYLTGKTFTARQAEQWEIITEVVPDGAAERRVSEVIGEIRGTAPVARSLVKRYLNDLVPIAADNGARRSWSSPDFVEGLTAFAEKRQPKYRYADGQGQP
jgi:enoyl-CoA hydratase/carnithine racemase